MNHTVSGQNIDSSVINISARQSVSVKPLIAHKATNDASAMLP